MRILTLVWAEGLWRAAYRWPDDPFALPRLLSTAPDLKTLRQTLESDHFGETMQPGQYGIIIWPDEAIEAARRVFDGFEVISASSDQEQIDSLETFLDADSLVQADPANRLALALTYWQAEPPSFVALYQALETRLLGAQPDRQKSAIARSELETIRQTLGLTLGGRSRRALTESYWQLVGAAPNIPVVPSQLLLSSGEYRGLPFRVLDLCATNTLKILPDLELFVVAVPADPGLDAADLDIIDHLLSNTNCRILLVLTDGKKDSEDLDTYSQIYDYFSEVLSRLYPHVGDRLKLIEPQRLSAQVRGTLSESMRQRLYDWLERNFSEGGMQSFHRARRWIDWTVSGF